MIFQNVNITYNSLYSAEGTERIIYIRVVPWVS